MKINSTNLKAATLAILVSGALAGCNGSSGGSSASNPSNPNNPNNPENIPANPSYLVMGEMEFDEATTHLDRYYDVKATFTNNSEAPISGVRVAANSEIQLVSSTCDGDMLIGDSCEVSGKFKPEQAGLNYELSYDFESDQTSARITTETTSAEPVLWYTTTPITNYSNSTVGLTSLVKFYNNTDEDMTRTMQWGVTNFDGASEFKDNNACDVIPAHGECEQRVYFSVPYTSDEDINLNADVIITDQDGNSSTVNYKTTATIMGMDYRSMDNHSGDSNYDQDVSTEPYYEMGKTYNGKFKMRIWDWNKDTDMVNLGSEITTDNGTATVIFTGAGDECAVRAPIGEAMIMNTDDCYVNYEYTPDHIGPVTFSITNQWTDTQAIADGVDNVRTSKWTELTKNVVEVVDIDVIVDGTTNEITAFTTEDIFKGKPHDARFNLLEDKDSRNGIEFGNQMELGDKAHDYNWETSDDRTGDYMKAKNAKFDGEFYAKIDGQLYNLSDADPKSEKAEVYREYIYNSDDLINLSGVQAEDSTALFVAPWYDQPVTHKINLRFITDVQ